MQKIFGLLKSLFCLLLIAACFYLASEAAGEGMQAAAGFGGGGIGITALLRSLLG